MGFAPIWLRQVSPLLHKTTLTTGAPIFKGPHECLIQLGLITFNEVLEAYSLEMTLTTDICTDLIQSSG